MLEFDLAIWYAFVGFISSFAGQKLIGYLLAKYKKTSIIILVIAISIGGSTILMSVTGIKDIIEVLHSYVYCVLLNLINMDE